MFTEELRKMRDGCRRLEQDWVQAQAEIAGLRKQLGEAREEIKRLNKGLAGRQKLGSDCQHCIFRLQAQRSLKED